MMFELLHALDGLFYTIISLLYIGSVGAGQMSAQLSVEREANGTLYTGSGVSFGGVSKSITMMDFANKPV